jgi:hypothetical protein
MDRQEWLHCSAATLAAESNFLIPKMSIVPRYSQL